MTIGAKNNENEIILDSLKVVVVIVFVIFVLFCFVLFYLVRYKLLLIFSLISKLNHCELEL